MARYDDDEDDDDRPRRKRKRDEDDDDDEEDEDERPRRRRRPLSDRSGSPSRNGGVTAVGIVTMVIGGLQVLAGCGCVVGGILFVTGGAAAGQAMNQDPRFQQQGMGNMFAGFGAVGGVMMFVGAVIVFAIAALHLWAGSGVLKRQAWARVVTLILASISGLFGLLGLLTLGQALFGAFRPPAASLAGNAVAILLYLGYAVLCYAVLLSPSASREFK